MGARRRPRPVAGDGRDGPQDPRRTGHERPRRLHAGRDRADGRRAARHGRELAVARSRPPARTAGGAAMNDEREDAQLRAGLARLAAAVPVEDGATSAQDGRRAPRGWLPLLGTLGAAFLLTLAGVFVVGVAPPSGGSPTPGS